MALRLESPDALPKVLRQRLRAFAAELAATDFWEVARDTPGLRQIEEELEAFLRAQKIQAYHCTKEAVSGFFQSHGLQPTDLKKHQGAFLADYGQIFTTHELGEIQSAWNNYFHRRAIASDGRNGMVWACLARSEVLSDGTSRFFEFFGGEAIYWPLMESPTVAPKLRSIGQRVVVEFAVPGQDIHTGRPLAWYVLSRHHQTVNRRAYLYLVEGRTLRAVTPAEILRVTPKAHFVG